MKKNQLTRRDFTKLTMAAFGGVVAGSAIGCGKDDATTTTTTDTGTAATTDDTGAAGTTPAEGEGAVAGVAKHACRGLNSCKNQGASGENACAGQGTCATVMHECAGQNDCKYLGGCGSDPAANECKGMGSCAVPIKKDVIWEEARKAFEARMKAQNKEFGEAPAAA